jgi:undecaprenyl-diphosphatase
VFWDLWTFNPYYHSLPSGHTTEIFGAILPLVLFFRRWPVTILLGLMAALVGFSRIYLHQHYPTDVMFGWLFGSYAGWATYAYWDHVRQTRKTPGSQALQQSHGYKPHE